MAATPSVFVDEVYIENVRLRLSQLRGDATAANIEVRMNALAAHRRRDDGRESAQAAERAAAAAGSSDAGVATTSPQERQLALARLLTFSPAAANRTRGLAVLEALEADGYRPSEVALTKAYALFESGRLRDCQAVLSRLMREEPTNNEAAALLEVLRGRYEQDGASGWMTWAVIGVAAVAVVAGVALLVASRRSPRQAVVGAAAAAAGAAAAVVPVASSAVGPSVGADVSGGAKADASAVRRA